MKPGCILVDCSEPELSRSLRQRGDAAAGDSNVIKKRLDLYRTITLPTLKILDDQQRLFIVSN
jgi:hypothetical protein